MAIATLNLSPRHAHLKIAANSYASAETRLDLGCSLDHWSQIVAVTVDGLEDDGTGTFVWDREANAFLVVTAISTGADLRVNEGPAENDASP